MPTQQHIIGILGGLGPYAHLDFEQKLLENAQTIARANTDQSYPEWILSSVPQTPDRTRAIRGEAHDPLPYLIRSLRRLERSSNDSPGADFAAMPCNTAHHYLDQLRHVATIPILDMIALTADSVAARVPSARVGILATTGTLEADVYGIALRNAGLTPVSLLQCDEAQSLQDKLIMTPIYGTNGIKASGAVDAARKPFTEACNVLVNELQADVLIAGCTEIPLALHGTEINGVPLIDPTRVLAEASIRIAYGLESLPPVQHPKDGAPR